MNLLIRKPSLKKIIFLMLPVFIGPASANNPLGVTALTPQYDQANETVIPLPDDSHGNLVEKNPATESATLKSTSILPARAPHEGIQANLFAGHSWYTPPPPPPMQVETESVAYTPTAPPLPFSYIGQYQQDGVETLFYLVRGDRVYDVKVGDVIDNTYRIDHVLNGQLMFTYLPLNTSQGLRLGDQ